MKNFEYMALPFSIMPEEIVDQYKLTNLLHKGMIYVEIQKGMPGLKQAGKIAHDRLREHFKKYGYAPVQRTPVLWKHNSTKIVFSLVVDDFGIKYIGKTDALHLIQALQNSYEITID